MKSLIAGLFCLSLVGVGVIAAPLEVRVDADKRLVSCSRGNLLGINIASYNQPEDFKAAVKGPLKALNIGLIRMPGGSFADKFYWNGNGVVVDGKIDTSKFKHNYWQVDYSNYAPGFSVNNDDWSKATAGMAMDTLTMHRITTLHPTAHNLVTVNAGSGTPAMAAEWVRWANLKNNFAVKYWEIGNELNGGWETGHKRPDGSTMTGEKYVEIFKAFADAMKAVDPSIKIGGPSCDVGHHDDYFEPLLREAGDKVDFLTLHFYSLRSSLAPEAELFDGLQSMAPITDHLQKLLQKYQPERADKIEISITEWNSKLPKDTDAYRLFNGLWFAAWIGEMMKCGIDSATVWDMFSGADNGHGLLVKRGDRYVPTGRYWGFWIWANKMADIMVESEITDNPDVHVYAVRDADSVRVLLMNESRSRSHPVRISVKGLQLDSLGEITTLSAREYFWNPYAGEADWNTPPSSKSLAVAGDGVTLALPPYCVQVVRFNRAGVHCEVAKADKAVSGKPELKLLLPESGAYDLAVEGWVRAFRQGSQQPYSQNVGAVELSVSGKAAITPQKLALDTAAAKFVLQPLGEGPVTVTARCGKLIASQTINFKPVKLEYMTAWPMDELPAGLTSAYAPAVADMPGAKRKALRLTFGNASIDQSSNHLLMIKKYPPNVPKDRIGGICFDLLVPKEFSCADEAVNIQAIMQSTGAYWIPCGAVKLKQNQGQWRTIRLEVPDKKFLKVMDRAFSVIFIITSSKPLNGPVYLDNLGFILRDE
jgi:alpha-L-arabinofuranosidase